MTETMEDPKPASLLDTKKFFEMTMADFNRDWKLLDQKSRDEIRLGIGNGTFTY